MNKNSIKWSSYIACLFACQYLSSCNDNTNNSEMEKSKNFNQREDSKYNDSKSIESKISDDSLRESKTNANKISKFYEEKESIKGEEEGIKDEEKKKEASTKDDCDITENDTKYENSSHLTNSAESDSENSVEPDSENESKNISETIVTSYYGESDIYADSNLRKAINYEEVWTSIQKEIAKENEEIAKRRNSSGSHNWLKKISAFSFKSIYQKLTQKKGPEVPNEDSFKSEYNELVSLISIIYSLNDGDLFLLRDKYYLKLFGFSRFQVENGKGLFKGKISDAATIDWNFTLNEISGKNPQETIFTVNDKKFKMHLCILNGIAAIWKVYNLNILK